MILHNFERFGRYWRVVVRWLEEKLLLILVVNCVNYLRLSEVVFPTWDSRALARWMRVFLLTHHRAHRWVCIYLPPSIAQLRQTHSYLIIYLGLFHTWSLEEFHLKFKIILGDILVYWCLLYSILRARGWMWVMHQLVLEMRLKLVLLLSRRGLERFEWLFEL